MGGPVLELLEGREVALGPTQVRRVLPNLGRRLVGPWCFVDHYGPDDIASGAGMAVPPHPHIGLQTVSWLLAGDVRHRDSLGSDQVITPGSLGLMTAGRGIVHAEHSPGFHPALLHGVQLWVALPDIARQTKPTWEHHPTLPLVTGQGLAATVIMGDFAGATSPGRTYSPIVGVDLRLAASADGVLPLESDFEYAILTLEGHAEVEGVALKPGAMLYLGTGRRDVALRSDAAATLLLLGGEPFEEQIVMWWNFVARTSEEVAAATAIWAAGGFGTVSGAGPPTPAPGPPPGRLKPGGGRREARPSHEARPSR